MKIIVKVGLGLDLGRICSGFLKKLLEFMDSFSTSWKRPHV